MKNVFLLLLFISTLNLFSQSEPEIKLNVSFNGKTHSINDGDTLNVDGNEIVVTTGDNLTFKSKRLTFEYPKYFAYEFEDESIAQSWTLDGNNFVIMYFEFGLELELDDFVDEIVKNFGKKNCKVSKKTIKLGGEVLVGKRIKVSLMGSELTYDMYDIHTDEKKSQFIAFQDSKNDDGSDSQEGIETLKIIDKTLKVIK